MLTMGLMILSCQYPKNPLSGGKTVATFSIENVTGHDFSGVLSLNYNEIRELEQYLDPGRLVVKYKNSISPVQLSDSDQDGKWDLLLFEASLLRDEMKDAEFRYLREDAMENLHFIKKTQAELWHKVTGTFQNGMYVGGGNFQKTDSLRVPDECTDHSYYIKYEGPGWESDKVGYRFYLDWRNAVDVFGKKTAAMVLKDVGTDGYESYHSMCPWGMDIMKVGNTLGIGSIAWWDGKKAVRVENTDSVICKIEADGLLRSQVKTWYFGWDRDGNKVDLISLKTIDAGSRITHERLSFSDTVSHIATGIRKEVNCELFTLTAENQQWNCMATWGPQSLAGDTLGLAVIYPAGIETNLTQDEDDWVVVFEQEGTIFDYFYLAAWTKEPGGIREKDQFMESLRAEMNLLSGPVKITRR